MNIVSMNDHRYGKKRNAASINLFSRLEFSLRSAGANFEKSVRIAKTLAPILQDQSSNQRHMTTISSDAPIQEKVIAILMLGFPKNQQTLPALQNILLTGSESLRIASAMAISQMYTKENSETLNDILLTGYKNSSSRQVKQTIRQAAPWLLGRKMANFAWRRS